MYFQVPVATDFITFACKQHKNILMFSKRSINIQFAAVWDIYDFDHDSDFR